MEGITSTEGRVRLCGLCEIHGLQVLNITTTKKRKKKSDKTNDHCQ